MEDQHYIFDPRTNTCKAPVPDIFEHLLGFISKIENFIALHSQTDITNINSQLDQTLNLMISNIIQRVIAQVIGKTDDGFETIKATDDGELHVHAPGIGAISDAIVAAGAVGSLSAKLRRVTQGLEDLKTGITLTSAGTVQIEGTSQTMLFKAISISGSSTHDIIAVATGKSHHITSIMFTVAGDVSVTLRDETEVLSGVMNFGGTNEPFGMCHNFGFIPLKCNSEKKFQITLDAAIQVSGVVTYYDA